MVGSIGFLCVIVSEVPVVWLGLRVRHKKSKRSRSEGRVVRSGGRQRGDVKTGVWVCLCVARQSVCVLEADIFSVILLVPGFLQDSHGMSINFTIHHKTGTGISSHI